SWVGLSRNSGSTRASCPARKAAFEREEDMLEKLPVAEANRIADLADEAREAQQLLLNKMQSDGQERPDAIREEAVETFAALDVSLNNPPLKRLQDEVNELPREARHELIALMLVGRGDYAAKEWDAALNQAAATPPDTEIARLVEKAQLSTYLKKGL